MKNIFYLFLAILLFSCKKEKEIKRQTLSEYIPSVPEIDSSTLTKIEFETQLIDLGELEEGIKVKVQYPFKNVGNNPLTISNCRGSGGCFVPSWPKESIPVGGRDTIFATFCTNNKRGKQTKNLTCTSNTYPINSVLKIKAEVINNNNTSVQFDYYEFDAGEVEEGTIVEYEFPFKNIGPKPLVISNCRSSCGCVIPYCPREPIPVGGTGIFSAKFETKGKSNIQHKTIMMDANMYPSPKVLKLKATIIPKE